MAETLREIADEITSLGADDGGMLTVSANRLRKWRHRILAFAGESEPVAWKVEHRPHLNPGYVELWTRKERADQQAESIRIGYPDDVVTVTPLYASHEEDDVS